MVLRNRLGQGVHGFGNQHLLERVRAGDLTQERLELAAYCGGPGAQLALGTKVATPPVDVVTWARGLSRWGKEAGVRAAVAAARYRLPDWQGLGVQDNSPEVAVELAEAWLNTRAPELEAEADGVSMAAWRAYKANLGLGVAADAAAVACHAAESVMRDAAFAAGLAADAADAALYEGAPDDPEERAAALRSAIHSPLLAWALR